jgi:hypothetical protein
VAAADINAWSPKLEGVVDDLKLEVQKIAKHWDHMVLYTLYQC